MRKIPTFSTLRWTISVTVAIWLFNVDYGLFGSELLLISLDCFWVPSICFCFCLIVWELSYISLKRFIFNFLLFFVYLWVLTLSMYVILLLECCFLSALLLYYILASLSANDLVPFTVLKCQLGSPFWLDLRDKSKGQIL